MTSFETIKPEEYKKLVNNENKNIQSNKKFYKSRDFK